MIAEIRIQSLTVLVLSLNAPGYVILIPSIERRTSREKRATLKCKTVGRIHWCVGGYCILGIGGVILIVVIDLARFRSLSLTQPRYPPSSVISSHTSSLGVVASISRRQMVFLSRRGDGQRSGCPNSKLELVAVARQYRWWLGRIYQACENSPCDQQQSMHLFTVRRTSLCLVIITNLRWRCALTPSLSGWLFYAMELENGV